MIESLSNRWAINLKKQIPDHPASVEVLAYAFNFMINIILTLAVSLTSALLLGHFWETVIVLSSFAILRMVSGGYHFRSAGACILFTVVGSNLLPYLYLDAQFTLLINILTLVLILSFAPSRIEHQSRIPKKYFPLLKAISSGLVSINFFLASSLIAATFFVQGITLLVSFLIERRDISDEKKESSL